LAGKLPGGKAYGYDLIESKAGERHINQTEAAIVRRIFRDFAAGKSPRAIAKELNAEGIPGPGGRDWRDTTIRGQAERGTGILNNAIYVGQLEWNRCSYIKNPKTGRRVARPNPRERWEIVEVPDLRIVDDDVWNRVKARQQELAHEIGRTEGGQALNRAHRRRFLLSGLLKCGACGGGYTIVAQDRYGCATRRSKGTCSNSATITRRQIEARVLSGLKDKLMAPELVRTFIEEFQAEVNHLQAERQAKMNAKRSRLQAVERKISGIVTAIEDGNYNKTLTERLSSLEREQETLEQDLSQFPDEPTVRLHPRLAEVYADKVARLEEALNDPAIKTEAAEIMRGLIDRIELRPREDGPGLQACLHGDLAQILTFCDGTKGKKKLPDPGGSGSQLSVVAGARNHRELTLSVMV
jgi:hypothetical protein